MESACGSSAISTFLRFETVKSVALLSFHVKLVDRCFDLDNLLCVSPTNSFWRILLRVKCLSHPSRNLSNARSHVFPVFGCTSHFDQFCFGVICVLYLIEVPKVLEGIARMGHETCHTGHENYEADFSGRSTINPNHIFAHLRFWMDRNTLTYRFVHNQSSQVTNSGTTSLFFKHKVSRTWLPRFLISAMHSRPVILFLFLASKPEHSRARVREVQPIVITQGSNSQWLSMSTLRIKASKPPLSPFPWVEYIANSYDLCNIELRAVNAVSSFSPQLELTLFESALYSLGNLGESSIYVGRLGNALRFQSRVQEIVPSIAKSQPTLEKIGYNSSFLCNLQRVV
ncbi:hypothetical protein Tco_0559479 [Tanacetum coccineum]